MSFIKKKFIYKEKSGTVTKVKLLWKFKEPNIKQLYFGTLVSAPHHYHGDNAQNTDFFQNTGLNESINMEVKITSEKR